MFLIGTSAKKTYGSIAVDHVVSIYDGDTFKVMIPEWPDIIGNEINVRIRGIDTPELRGKCDAEVLLARMARDRVAFWFEMHPMIELRNIGRGKYFRIIADVIDIDSDESLGDILIEEGFAKPYDGRKKNSNWCDLDVPKPKNKNKGNKNSKDDENKNGEPNKKRNLDRPKRLKAMQ